MEQEKDMVMKRIVFKVAKANIDTHKDTVMVDMFDENYNRLAFNKDSKRRFAFDAFYLKERILGDVPEGVTFKTVYDVIDFLKTQGVSMVYTANKEG